MLRLPSLQRFSWACCLLLLAGSSPAFAVKPSQELLPNTTKGYVSVPDVDLLRSKWRETEWGALMADPAMKPFADDLREQIKEKLSQSGIALGVTWDDLDGVYAGEVALARIQPNNDAKEYATAIVVDVTGKDEALQALLTKIDGNMRARKARRATDKVGDTTLTIYTIPPKNAGEAARQAIFFTRENQFVAVDHDATARGILGRFGGEAADRLAALPAYSSVMKRVGDASGDLTPNLRWFIEPFGYTQVARASQGGRKKRGKDMLKVLAGQGFDAIAGLGGFVNLATEKYEAIHRTFIYAPAVPAAKEGEKYLLAARMLNFPNGGQLAPHDWIPRELAAYGSFHAKLGPAFNYSSTLVDEIAGEPGFFQDLLDSLRDDPHGPQIDIRADLVPNLGERVTVITDYRLPITPDSERLLTAIELTNAKQVADLLQRAMQSDPDARRVEIHGHVVWEIVNEDDASAEMPGLVIDGPGIVPIAAQDEDEEEARVIPNAALTVAHGHLIVASHIDFIGRVLAPEPGGSLAQARDYQLVMDELNKLGGGPDSFRLFSRTDEEYRTSYELIKQGKMPESKSMFGKLLNQILGSGEKGEVRTQEIDGSKLPDYQVARRYLGPAGLYVQSEDDGWLLVGVCLSKAPATEENLDRDAEAERPALATALKEELGVPAETAADTAADTTATDAAAGEPTTDEEPAPAVPGETPMNETQTEVAGDVESVNQTAE